MPHARARAKKLVAGVAFIAVAGVLAACGSDDGGGKPGKDSMPTIRLGVPANDPAFLPVFTAALDGSFKDAGVNVETEIVSANSIVVQLAAKQFDLVVSGTPNALVPAENGLNTSVVYANGAFGQSAFIIGNADVKTVSDCKTLIGGSTGSGTIAMAREVGDLLHLDWKVLEIVDFSARLAALSSGRADCGFGGAFLPLVGQDGVHIVLDPRQASYLPEGFPTTLVAGAFYGVSENLQDKKDAVSRFLKGITTTLDRTVTKKTPAELVAMLKDGDPKFADVNTDSFEAAIDAYAPFYAPDQGYITPEAWQTTLDVFGYKGGGLEDLADGDEMWSYASRVDMSYLEDAGVKPPDAS